MNNKLSKEIGFRVEPEFATLLESVAHGRGEDVSDFVRRAVRTELARLSYLSDSEKKALGVRS